MKWNKEENKVVTECFYISKPFGEEGNPIREYRKRMFKEWRERGKFESTEQLVCGQARAIRKNGEQDITVDAETKDTDVGTVEEEINDVKDSIGDTGEI